MVTQLGMLPRVKYHLLRKMIKRLRDLTLEVEGKTLMEVQDIYKREFGKYYK